MNTMTLISIPNRCCRKYLQGQYEQWTECNFYYWFKVVLTKIVNCQSGVVLESVFFMVKVKKIEGTVISLSQPEFLYDRKKIAVVLCYAVGAWRFPQLNFCCSEPFHLNILTHTCTIQCGIDFEGSSSYRFLGEGPKGHFLKFCYNFFIFHLI